MKPLSPMRCLIVDDDALVRAIMENFVDQHDGLTLVETCSSAIEASNFLDKERVDVIFLDVEMPGMTGLDLVKSLSERPQIVLVTSKAEYAVDAFEVEVTDYLLKPVTYARFLKAVQRVQRKVEEANSAATPITDEKTVFIKSEGRLVKVNLDEIQWVEAQGDYVMIHTEEDRHIVHSTMKGMSSKLPDHDFVRVHRSYIVRIDQIEDIEDASLVIGRKVIPIGASYKSKLLSRLNTL